MGNYINSSEPVVVSASRRTDIPAYYGGWFMERLNRGTVSYRHPFNRSRITVSVQPENVINFVFWTKNCGPFLNYLPLISEKGYKFYCHYTITGHPVYLEEKSPPLEESVKTFKKVSGITGEKFALWRFDPIIFTSDLNEKYYIKKFMEIAGKLEGFTQSCYISIVSLYKKTVRNMAAKGIMYEEAGNKRAGELAFKIGLLAKEYGISVYSCCTDFLISGVVQKGSCVNRELIKELAGNPDLKLPKRPSRKGCGCYKSVDIGAYNSCTNGCIYCYANANQKSAENNYRRHDKTGEMLIP